MQEQSPLDPPERELEEALASLAPSPVGISGEALWDRATVLHERRRANRWRAAAVIAFLAAGAALLWRPNPVTLTVDHVVVVRQQEKPAGPAAPAPVVANADSGRNERDDVTSLAYLLLRDELVRHGPDSLRATAAGEGNDADVQRAWSPRDALMGTEAPLKFQHNFIRGG